MICTPYDHRGALLLISGGLLPFSSQMLLDLFYFEWPFGHIRISNKRCVLPPPFSICEEFGEQQNFFQVEEQHTLQEVITEETRNSSSCSCYSIPCATASCVASEERGGSVESDSGLSSSWLTPDLRGWGLGGPKWERMIKQNHVVCRSLQDLWFLKLFRT